MIAFLLSLLMLPQVVVISVDGLRPDALTQTPHIHVLAERGAVDWAAQTLFPPATLPAHAAMLTGLPDHGVTWNDYRAEKIDLTTFLDLTAEAGYRTAMVVGKEKLHQLHHNETVEYSFMHEGDRSVIDEALRLLDDGVEVLFVHLPNTDYFGHSEGWMSETYLRELGNTDVQIGRLLAALDENTFVILTSDHGGHGMVHGADIPEDMTIPWIIAGPGIDPGTTLDDVRVSQTAATVLAALGLPVPDGMDDPAILPLTCGGVFNNTPDPA